MIYDVKNVIIVHSIDYEVKGGPQKYYLSTNKKDFEPPSFDEESDKGRLLESYLKLHFSWLNTLIKLNDVIQEKGEENKLTIVWSCIVPYDTPLINSYWIPIDNVKSNYLRNINT